MNRISPGGLPEFFIKDIPRLDDAPEGHPSEHLLRGELQRICLRPVQNAGVRLPRGRQERILRYEGKGGVPLSFLKKLIFAVRFGSITLLLSDDITSDSRG